MDGLTSMFEMLLYKEAVIVAQSASYHKWRGGMACSARV